MILNHKSRARIGLTGAKGVLGRTLQSEWTDAEWIIFQGDVRDLAALKNWYESVGILDGMFHFAAVVPTHKIVSEPLLGLKSNVEGTLNLLEVLRVNLVEHKRQPWFFFASTSHVYKSNDLPLSEDAALEPMSLYGLTKLQAEEWVRVYSKEFGLKSCIGRIFSYTSSLQPESYFIPSLIKKVIAAEKGAKLEIPGLHGTRDFLDAKSIVQTVGRLFEQKAEGVFNIGSGKPQRLLDMANEVCRVLKREDVQIVPLEKGTAHLNANTTKLNAIGIKPEFDLKRLIEDVCETQLKLPKN